LVAVLRFIGNVLLAILVIVLTVAILLTGYGAVMTSVWETADPYEAVADGAWADIDGQGIYYQVVGLEEGTAVLLIHGLGVEGLQVWDDSALDLSRSGLRVISADLSGFGYSTRDGSTNSSLDIQAETLVTLLDQLGVEQVTAVGQGWGGSVALRLAEDRPDLVHQVVLVAPWLGEIPAIWPPLLQLPYASRGAAWVVGSGGPIWGLVRRLGFDSRAAFSSELLSNMREPTHVRGTVDALLRRLLDRPESISDIDISQVRAPVLIIAGDKDRFVPLEDVERFAERFPNATLITVEDAGHYVHIEQRLVVNRDLAQFCLGTNP
jgi:pimeloyl-ACP methyl ester carboxylesterase